MWFLEKAGLVEANEAEAWLQQQLVTLDRDKPRRRHLFLQSVDESILYSFGLWLKLCPDSIQTLFATRQDSAAETSNVADWADWTNRAQCGRCPSQHLTFGTGTSSRDSAYMYMCIFHGLEMDVDVDVDVAEGEGEGEGEGEM